MLELNFRFQVSGCMLQRDELLWEKLLMSLNLTFFQNLCLKIISADGHCLFSSLADQYNKKVPGELLLSIAIQSSVFNYVGSFIIFASQEPSFTILRPSEIWLRVTWKIIKKISWGS